MTSDSVFVGLCSGDYTISLTDANGCSSLLINGGVDQQQIGTSVNTTAAIDPLSVINVLCNGAATGSASALNPNMNTGYSYTWENVINPNVTISSSYSVNNLMAGTYVLYAHYADPNNLGQPYVGCTTTDTIVVTELSALESVGQVIDVDCYGNATGSINVTQVTGGTSPYNMQFNPGGQNTSLLAGTYTLTITDGNSCQEVDTFVVNEPQALVANISQNGYVLTASVPNGGVGPYSYSWREQSSPFVQIGTGTSYTVTNYGTYYVIVTDANGCTSTSNSFDFDDATAVDGGSVIDMVIYPNPFRDETTIDFGREVNDLSIRVVDVYGKLIEEHLVDKADTYVLSRGNKASGVYFVEIEIGEIKHFNKIIVE